MTRLPLNYLPLNEFHIANCAKMVPFSGYNMPINYNSGIINEHKNVRYQSGVFDVSHMGQILILNNEYNLRNLEKYIPLCLNKLHHNRSSYSFLLNEKGGIIDDIIISKIKIEKISYFYIIYNASRKKQDESIFLNCADEYILLNKNCLFAIQGPESEYVLNSIVNIPSNMIFLDSFILNYKNTNTIISRTGYTGEDGFEISISTSIAESFIVELIKNNKTTLCGLGSRDSLRLEAGLSLYGHELTEDITPIEAGLSWAIHKERLEDDSLNGRIVLTNQLKNKPPNKKIGIISINKSIIREGMQLFDTNKNLIGKVTSGCFSPILNKSIAIGYIKYDFNLSNEIYCDIRNKIELVKISKLPFVNKNYKT